MLAAIRSAAVLGIDTFEVTVEVDVAQGLPHWTVVGTEPLQDCLPKELKQGGPRPVMTKRGSVEKSKERARCGCTLVSAK